MPLWRRHGDGMYSHATFKKLSTRFNAGTLTNLRQDMATVALYFSLRTTSNDILRLYVHQKQQTYSIDNTRSISWNSYITFGSKARCTWTKGLNQCTIILIVQEKSLISKISCCLSISVSVILAFDVPKICNRTNTRNKTARHDCI